MANDITKREILIKNHRHFLLEFIMRMNIFYDAYFYFDRLSCFVNAFLMCFGSYRFYERRLIKSILVLLFMSVALTSIYFYSIYFLFIYLKVKNSLRFYVLGLLCLDYHCWFYYFWLNVITFIIIYKYFRQIVKIRTKIYNAKTWQKC